MESKKSHIVWTSYDNLLIYLFVFWFVSFFILRDTVSFGNALTFSLSKKFTDLRMCSKTSNLYFK